LLSLKIKIIAAQNIKDKWKSDSVDFNKGLPTFYNATLNLKGPSKGWQPLLHF
jgi:hypothetical protein